MYAGYRPVCKNNQASDADSFVFSRKKILNLRGGANYCTHLITPIFKSGDTILSQELSTDFLVVYHL